MTERRMFITTDSQSIEEILEILEYVRIELEEQLIPKLHEVIVNEDGTVSYDMIPVSMGFNGPNGFQHRIIFNKKSKL